MRNHIEKVLRIGCIALGALLLFQVVRTVMHSNPLAKVTIPAVPTLGGNTNTNATASAKSTNTSAAKIGTNAPVAAVAKAGVTNVSSTNVPPATNAVVAADTNKPTVTVAAKEVPANAVTNAVTQPDGAAVAVQSNENVVPQKIESGTNAVAVRAINKSGTNGVAISEVSTNGTNASVRVVTKKPSPSRPDMTSMGMPGMPGMSGAGKPPAELSPAIKARVDRIYESELFGQVMRPMPAALMGIAGNSAFLRTSSGQTGLVKEGDSLGEMKLIRIGINRVLVEEKGEKKELMIFNGYGGESLMAKQNETPNETTSK